MIEKTADTTASAAAVRAGWPCPCRPLRHLVVAQLGARMHYAVPAAAHRIGILERFHTDFFLSGRMALVLQRIPGIGRLQGVRRLAGRTTPALSGAAVCSHPVLGLKYYRARRRTRTQNELSSAYLKGGRLFAKVVASALAANVDGVYGFNGASLELFRAVEKRGVFRMLEQTIAPLRFRRGLLAEEATRHPGLEDDRGVAPALSQLGEREEREWEHADVIVCGSAFVRNGIAACGGPVDRCVVIPYGVSLKTFAQPARTPAAGRPLRVLTVGEVGLRKGSPYVLEAARRLVGRAEFRMIGPVRLRVDRVQLPSNLEMCGAVPRTDVPNHLRWADVFLLPSLCEGSATASYEALVAGLPIIVTPNTGALVDPEVNGYEVPIRDVDTIVARLTEIAEDPTLWQTLSAGARASVTTAGMDAYHRRLHALWGHG